MVVTIIDPQLPHAHWPVGRVVKLIVSADGCSRLAVAKVKDRISLRPVACLVHRPGIPDDKVQGATVTTWGIQRILCIIVTQFWGLRILGLRIPLYIYTVNALTLACIPLAAGL